MYNDQLKKRAEKDVEYMFSQLDGVDVDAIKTEGVTVRVGNKLMKLELVSEDPLSVEDEIRKEFREKLTSQLQKIKERINTKITEMSEFVSTIKREYERKEKDLQERLNKSQPMPDVNYTLASKGLSVAKGNYKDEIIWLVQGIYWPKYVDYVPIESRYSKKMLSSVVFMIETTRDKIMRVSTRKPLGLDYFSHYHQSSPDCWGNWKHAAKWKKPEDIIQVAREAEVVLENVNTGSIATNSPRGLPRKATLMRHLLPDKDKQAEDRMGTLSQANRRAGITPGMRENSDIWQL